MRNLLSHLKTPILHVHAFKCLLKPITLKTLQTNLFFRKKEKLNFTFEENKIFKNLYYSKL